MACQIRGRRLIITIEQTQLYVWKRIHETRRLQFENDVISNFMVGITTISYEVLFNSIMRDCLLDINTNFIKSTTK